MTQSRLKHLLDMTVLVAEDDPAMRDSLARTVGVFFGEVLVAGNGQQAMKLFECQTVHMALLDIAMPGLTGLEVAARIRAQDPDLPVIILTCHSDVAFMQTAVELRLMAYLLKPVELPLLQAALGRCLDQMQQRGRLATRLQGGAMFNPITGVVDREGQQVSLTRNEKRFLAYMLQRRGTMVAPHHICRELGVEAQLSLNALRNLVYRLRAKIGPDALICSKEIGYTLP